MAKMSRVAMGVVLFVGWVWTADAHGQSFFERLTEQLGKTTPPATAAPPVVEEGAPVETLPPPRESGAAVVPARPLLGIKVGPVTEEVVRTQKLVVRRGAVITSIEQGSAADRAGLPLGAVIVAVDGRRIDSPDDLVAVIQATPAGRDLELTYYDRDKLARKRVHLAAGTASGMFAPATLPPAATAAAPLEPGRSAVPSTNLERELGAGGSRPILGRLGRAIDSFATQAQALQPAAGTSPAAAPTPASNPAAIAELQRQVAELTQEVALLRAQIRDLEKRVPPAR